MRITRNAIAALKGLAGGDHDEFTERDFITIPGVSRASLNRFINEKWIEEIGNAGLLSQPRYRITAIGKSCLAAVDFAG